MVARGPGGPQAASRNLPSARPPCSPRPPSPCRRRASRPRRRVAASWWAFGEGGLVASQWLLLLLPSVLFVRAGGWDLRATLSLRPASAGAVGAGLLLVAGAAPVGWYLAWVQTLFIPVPREMLEALEGLLRADSPGRLAWLFLAVAVTPAICEEVLFRGVLLGATRSLGPVRFLLLNGLVFGTFHLSTESAIRFLPTAWLGIVLAWAVWRTGSLYVGVLMHLANNGVILLAAVGAPAVGETTTDPLAPPPLWILPPALVALALGVRALSHPTDGPTTGSGVSATTGVS